ncbi:MAG: adenylyltransferase/cytidyltransferase family protein, partial [Verrucomicrobia bacterium]|nr:adenylyltransferase/cytidyltransferase family protein [Verrucomicrobiota bacterium]
MIARLGILGGSFNPVHLGHLIMARDALERFRLDRVLFVPCARPPHKAAGELAP